MFDQSTSDTDLLGRAFARQSPGGAWKMPRNCLLPRSMATEVELSDAFDVMQMENGEEPIQLCNRVDKTIRTLALFGVPKSEGDVDRKMVRVLTDEFEIEQRTLLYRDEFN